MSKYYTIDAINHRFASGGVDQIIRNKLKFTLVTVPDLEYVEERKVEFGDDWVNVIVTRYHGSRVEEETVYKDNLPSRFVEGHVKAMLVDCLDGSYKRWVEID